ncbi:MAG: N-acetyltransferase family protein [Chloroflexota bacterium]
MASVSKRPEVIIRRLEIDDLSAVYRLGEELFTSEEYPILYRTWDPYEVSGLFTSDSEYCFVAESDNRVVGFALATTFEKEGTAWKRYGYVNWIGVSAEVQGLHVGSRLYRRLEDAFREDGVRMMIADTVVENENAIGFFRDLGFNTSGRHVWLTKTLRKEDGREGQEPPEKKMNRKKARRVAQDAPSGLQSKYRIADDTA